MPSISANGTTFNYRFDGPEKGRVVMLSNSLASSLAMWDLQVPALISAGFRVLCYDSRGHGLSAVPAGPYTMDQLTADAVGLLDALGLERIHFCGLSMGGMVGQTLGAQYGGRLISLILSSTSPFMAQKEVWNERIALVRKDGMKAVVDATLDRWYTKAGQARLPEEVAKTRQMILATPVEGFCASSTAIRDMDLRGLHRAIKAPTLILVGEHDPGTPVSAAEEIHAGIAGSRLRIFPAVAHFCNVERADLFNGALLDFLSRHNG
jgi:3-oxoadipate enol-lactonase